MKHRSLLLRLLLWVGTTACQQILRLVAMGIPFCMSQDVQHAKMTTSTAELEHDKPLQGEGAYLFHAGLHCLH